MCARRTSAVSTRSRSARGRLRRDRQPLEGRGGAGDSEPQSDVGAGRESGVAVRRSEAKPSRAAVEAPDVRARQSPLATRRSEGFFRSRWVDVPAGVEELDPEQLAPGFRAGAAASGLKDGGETDVAIVACDVDSPRSALLLTSNAAAAAPVRVCRDN